MVVTRPEAIDRIRRMLLELTDDEHSICQVAAERGIFCRGFHQYTEQELREHYGWLLMRRRSIPRERLEALANSWQLGRQVYQDLPLACDVQQREHDTCGGWDEFTNEDLARFCEELTHEQLTVV